MPVTRPYRSSIFLKDSRAPLRVDQFPTVDMDESTNIEPAIPETMSKKNKHVPFWQNYISIIKTLIR